METCSQKWICIVVCVLVLSWLLSCRRNEFLLTKNITPFDHTNLNMLTSNDEGNITVIPTSHFVNETIPRTVPLGTISASLLPTEPKEYGWYFCNGQEILHNDLTREFAQLMQIHPNNGGKIKLPDLKGRFMVGTGNEYTLGARGGEKTHTLTLNEMPRHKHNVSVHNANAGTLRNKKSDDRGHHNDFDQGSGTTNGDVHLNHSHGVTEHDKGGNAAHENRPPYHAVHYIIKVHY